jgi:sugar O-acyltransferase (sialic acid O-acetyltransferase NeuD family)
MKRIILIGAGGHARVVADLVQSIDDWELVGYLDTVDPSRKGEEILGAVVLGGDEALAIARENGVAAVFPAFGNNRLRVECCDRLAGDGWEVPALASPAAHVSPHCALGAGVVIMAGAVVQPGTVIGRAAIVNTGATVDHDCTIAEGAHLAPGCHLAGHVSVGARSLIGVGAAVRDGVAIGADVTIGCGAAVVGNLPDGCLAVGVPARVVKMNYCES